MVLTGFSSGGAALGTAFLASVVEVVEAFTIILAVGTVQGWRPAVAGGLAGLLVLALVVLAFGPMLQLVPIHALQLAVGVLLLLFGMRWLRKAILRSVGVVPRRDELAAFAGQAADLITEASRKNTRLDWLAGVATFKAVVLEGLEVVFIVIAVGAARGLLWPASLGALAACALVLAIGLILQRPLARVPENSLKFGVGVMLSAFGVFWTGEGLGVAWPGHDLALVAFAALFLLVGLLAVPSVARIEAGASQ
ncbi:MAG: hypothetical protein JWP50_1939 [Phenylobacterium sp.]|nr:hypothetical protein [Phenylobacterium sp.]